MMKRLLNVGGGLLGLLAVIALVVVLALTFGGLRRGAEPEPQVFRSPIETPTQPPYPPPVTPTPLGPPATPTQPPYPPPATPTIAPTAVPRCTFAARSAPAVPGPSLDTYHFSEPQVVLTHTSAIGIAGWLPDGQRLLITRDIPGTNRQAIETFNIRTGELSVYAERNGSNGKPIWLLALNAVAYSTLVDQHHELWVSRGDPQRVERAVPDVLGLSLATEPDGKHLLYFSRLTGERPQQLNVETRAVQEMPLDLAQLRYPKYPEPVQSMLGPSVFKIVWRPDGSQVVFYTIPWTFLFDVTTNQVCEIDLGQTRVEGMPIWALEAKWSPNGRYLALITTGTFPGQASGTGASILYTELTILDMETGNLRILQPAPDINGGQHYVTDITWAPDSYYLAVLGIVRIDEMGSEKEVVFIVDATTGELRQSLSDRDLGGGLWHWQIAWSPDGSQLAVNCPTSEEGRLCILSVKPQNSQEEQP
jgi:WD40 repeat protein